MEKANDGSVKRGGIGEKERQVANSGIKNRRTHSLGDGGENPYWEEKIGTAQTGA